MPEKGILGTANRGRFSAKVGHGETRRLPQELIDGVKSGMQKLDIRGLVSIGGDGSLSIGEPGEVWAACQNQKIG